MRDLRDPRLWLTILATGLLCCWAWQPVYGEVTITPPPHKVTAGHVSLFELQGFTPADVPKTTIACQPVNGFVDRHVGPEGRQFIWFRPANDGFCILGVAISTGADTPPDLMMVPIDVGGDGPQPQPDPQPDPDPGPQPDPLPPPGPRRIVVIIERSTPIPTPEQAKVIAALDQWKETAGYTPETYRVADPNQVNASEEPVTWLQPYLRAIQERGINHPVLIIDCEPFGTVDPYDVIEPLPATGKAAIELIESHTDQ